VQTSYKRKRRRQIICRMQTHLGGCKRQETRTGQTRQETRTGQTRQETRTGQTRQETRTGQTRQETRTGQTRQEARTGQTRTRTRMVVSKKETSPRVLKLSDDLTHSAIHMVSAHTRIYASARALPTCVSSRVQMLRRTHNFGGLCSQNSPTYMSYICERMVILSKSTLAHLNSFMCEHHHGHVYLKCLHMMYAYTHTHTHIHVHIHSYTTCYIFHLHGYIHTRTYVFNLWQLCATCSIRCF
jgi:hypothetical protein